MKPANSNNPLFELDRLIIRSDYICHSFLKIIPFIDRFYGTDKEKQNALNLSQNLNWLSSELKKHRTYKNYNFCLIKPKKILDEAEKIINAVNYYQTIRGGGLI